MTRDPHLEVKVTCMEAYCEAGVHTAQIVLATESAGLLNTRSKITVLNFIDFIFRGEGATFHC